MNDDDDDDDDDARRDETTTRRSRASEKTRRDRFSRSRAKTRARAAVCRHRDASFKFARAVVTRTRDDARRREAIGRAAMIREVGVGAESTSAARANDGGEGETARKLCACEGCRSCATFRGFARARASGSDANGDGGVNGGVGGGEGGGGCENEPQRYTNVDSRTGHERRGFRKLCKPCLRRREKDREEARRGHGGDGDASARRRRSVANGGSGAAAEARHEVEDDGTVGKKQKTTTVRVVDKGRAHRESIVLFGDSLTERAFEDGGFGARLAHEFRRFADVRGRGYSGYNTEHALCVLDEVFPIDDSSSHSLTSTSSATPVLVTVLFGSNDACAKSSSAGPVQHVPVERYEHNLRTIASHLRRMKPTPRILFITPPPVDDEAWMRDCSTRAADPASGFGDLLRGDEPNRTNAGIKPYVEAMKRVARALDVPIVDLHQYLEFSNGHVDETQFVDGLHFSEAGQRQVASCVVDAVRASFPQLARRASDAIKCDFPDWKHLDAVKFPAQITNHHASVARVPDGAVAP